ncbi:MAG TPA: hypothetical protein ENK06_14005 [Gammaproteobacteria bacterium]|nr:hypothetical protein [Gammaproteobacteria bacterium]
MPDTTEKLIKAYNQLLQTTKEIIDMAKREATPAIHDAIDKAKEGLTEASELTAEEIDKVSDYLKRDLHDAAEFIAEGEREIADWLRIDVLYIEDRLLEMFSHMVDETALALEQIRQNAEQANTWHTGEITGIGTLLCKKCGEELHFKKTGHIPPCPKCHHTEFERRSD